MPRKSPRMHTLYTDRDHTSGVGSRIEGNARGEANKAKSAPRRRIYSAKFTAKTYLLGKAPADPRAARARALFVAARVSRKRPPKSIRTVGQKTHRKPSGYGNGVNTPECHSAFPHSSSRSS